MVYRLRSVEKCALPTSTVFPLARSSSLVSIIKAKNHESRFRSFASFSYRSIVRLSTLSVKYNILPDKVDFPASTCPMNTNVKCSRGSPSLTATAVSVAVATSSFSSSTPTTSFIGPLSVRITSFDASSSTIGSDV